MPRFKITITEAVWQSTIFQCEAESAEHAEDQAFELEQEALNQERQDGGGHITTTTISGVDDTPGQITVTPIED